ncbi:helix-turn-helix domain-containing protein [Nocardia mangyaensis]|uniref:helix-turn-helix domain-containing protein n=1 Tax=Nocardia mangyaensis TaxID=2213200 RepID=UPI0026756AD9|nr:helix-turn-helix domain-containing protein [Nocardia mangyaensis]MDO3645702.1 helix-turn-helix domain-containing protein [Nocardia mangyaensis]
MADYRERAARLDRAVVWSVSGRSGPVPVYPDGCMDLIWTEGVLMVAGPDSRTFHTTADRAGDYVGIRFAPGTAPALLGIPAVELRDQRVGLSEVFTDRRARALLDRIDNAPDRVAALDTIAVELAAEAKPPDPALTAVVDMLAAGGSVADTAVGTGLSARMLHRRSLSAFGYGPKMLARVLRFQRALARIRAGKSAAETAAATGFADQAHLAREVRDLAGCTVGALYSG